MKHITITVPAGEGNNISSIIGAYKVLSRANEHYQSLHNKTLYKIEVAGITKKVAYFDGLCTIRPHKHISAISRTDLVIIPSLNHAYEEAIRKNKLLIEWIKMQHAQGAEIASICTGGFLLAATGLLEGKTCSTHWSAEHQMRKMFPGINLQTDKLITDHDGIYTNGGAFSFLNLIIYLVEKYFDRPTAIWCAKVFQIEMDRNSQSPFIIFNGQKQHGDEVVKEAQTYIEQQLDEHISFGELSARLSVGRRNFDRRFIKATGNTPLEYAQRVKIEAAKKSLESTRKTISEVMYEVGYADMKAFREIFRRITGMSPLDYRKEYNNAALMD